MQAKKIFPNWVWLIYLLLFSFSIPWYLPEDLTMHLAFGLPLWLVFCITAILGIALFTLWIIRKFWKE